ncbi:MAG: hypothetical protein BWX70_00079 [Verrucomicrobia bacterium ADurb.Bin070]|jgi:hypothetical protein|nr:MAG: hypothetical protein BWX70_00079 [Verrucomicrobia bacterium ADurb.Bin070]
MMTFRIAARAAGALLVVLAATLAGAAIKIDPGNMSPYSKTKVGINLYSKPDPSAGGGLRGMIAGNPSEVLGVLAMPQKFPHISALSDVEGGGSTKNARNINKDMTNQVYLAALGANNAFSFYGLPPGKYDLFVLCENCFYEGLLLSREPNTLADPDVRAIKAKVNESNPFFNVKNQHRIEGQGGTFGKARVLEQEVRTLPVTLQSAEVLKHIQIRSIKLCLMESVGTSKLGTHWEMKKTREIARQEMGPPDTKGLIPGYFCKPLQGIRVATSVKDLGTITLASDPAPGTSAVPAQESR